MWDPALLRIASFGSKLSSLVPAAGLGFRQGTQARDRQRGRVAAFEKLESWAGTGRVGFSSGGSQEQGNGSVIGTEF